MSAASERPPYPRDDPAYWLGLVERRREEGGTAPITLTLDQQILVLRAAVGESLLRRHLADLQRQWRASSADYLSNAKNPIDAGLGGAYSVASETLRLLLADPRYRPGTSSAEEASDA